ncbi:cytochrome b [Novosphingobium album (ex Hu et al. 2023)]|uniref:Cytochrome b n=1 Tax=Novosphingobium album (ex Hu et al. 2023) TaxID=2930093 RepID=A0ABT0AYK8_9SPHN|nr:cytochrome b [Novosphingobium album (ex Hu et al. 2023)]MCJ2177896.1 cytochrome b [Novosphingobium album (ex Hu et al. 2023)]
METKQYSPVAVVLHWLIALLIALNFVAAWVAEDMPKAEKMQIMGNHKAFGLTILVLTVIRILWRVLHKAPAFSSALSAWEVALARVTHALFYFLMLGIPLTGWGMVSGGGNPVSWFGLFEIPALPVGGDKALGGIFHESHEALATVMLVLFALHVAGALKHHFLDHDDTMARMVPFLRRR